MTTTALLLVLAMTAARATDSGGFVFQVPDGWSDLSSGVPESELPALPDEIRAIRKGFPVFAMDLAHAGDGFAENMNVSVLPVKGAVDQEVVDATAESLVVNGGPGTEVTIVSKVVVPVGGIACGRIESVASGSMKVHQLTWILPGSEAVAVLTFTASPDSFASYVGTFDASARATKGIALATGQQQDLPRERRRKKRG